jgi:hypothetical protein
MSKVTSRNWEHPHYQCKNFTQDVKNQIRGLSNQALGEYAEAFFSNRAECAPVNRGDIIRLICAVTEAEWKKGFCEMHGISLWAKATKRGDHNLFNRVMGSPLLKSFKAWRQQFIENELKDEIIQVVPDSREGEDAGTYKGDPRWRLFSLGEAGPTFITKEEAVIHGIELVLDKRQEIEKEGGTDPQTPIVSF